MLLEVLIEEMHKTSHLEAVFASLLPPHLEDVLFPGDDKVVLPVINHSAHLVSQQGLSVFLFFVDLIEVELGLLFYLTELEFAGLYSLSLNLLLFNFKLSRVLLRSFFKNVHISTPVGESIVEQSVCHSLEYS